MCEGQYGEFIGKINYPIFLGNLFPAALKFPKEIIAQAKETFDREYLSFCAWIYI
jgi:hypothetical protein